MNFSAIRRAGLTQLEFANFVGVSRVTANMWVRGKIQPHRYIQSKIATALGLIESAILSAKLPLPDSVRREDRMLALGAVLRAENERLATRKSTSAG